MFTTPILFLIFNRPETTKLVFEKIRQQKPSTLFIASDGPRESKRGEVLICDECRKIVLNGIDWPCEVKTLFRQENLGCGRGVSSAITWFFDHVEEGIILEDDVLPNKSFFAFCSAMLTRFKDDENIMHISGNNFQLSQVGTNSYYLSKLPHSWGWATWRRAWRKFDFELNSFNEEHVNSYFNYATIDNFWHTMFKNTKYELHQHVWDYQWTFTVFHHGGLCVLPQFNLVTNIGFGENASHTSNTEDFLANLKAYEMVIPCEEKKAAYNPVADINSHILLKWELSKKAAPLSLSTRAFNRFIRTSKRIFK
jgi:hypothetical protein